MRHGEDAAVETVGNGAARRWRLLYRDSLIDGAGDIHGLIVRRKRGCPKAPPERGVTCREETRRRAQEKRRSLKLMLRFQSSTLPTRRMLAQVPL